MRYGSDGADQERIEPVNYLTVQAADMKSNCSLSSTIFIAGLALISHRAPPVSGFRRGQMILQSPPASCLSSPA